MGIDQLTTLIIHINRQSMGMSLITMIPGNENHFSTVLSLFAVLATFDARLRIIFCYFINHSWEFRMKDQSQRMGRHIKEEEEITISS